MRLPGVDTASAGARACVSRGSRVRPLPVMAGDSSRLHPPSPREKERRRLLWRRSEGAAGGMVRRTPTSMQKVRSVALRNVGCVTVCFLCRAWGRQTPVARARRRSCLSGAERWSFPNELA